MPLAEYLRSQDVNGGSDLIEFFDTMLFAVPVPIDARQRVADIYRSGGGSSENRIKEAVHVLCTLPEFQLA